MAAVAIGVAGEVIHDFLDWFKSFTWWRTKGNKASALLLVVALVAELVIQVKANSISGRIIATLENETAEERARTADIEKLTAWRMLPQDELDTLKKSLSDVPRDVPRSVVFAYPPSDMECLYVAMQIGGVFIQLKDWNLEAQTRTYPSMVYWGLRILGRETPTTLAIRKAFLDAHIEFSTDDFPGGFQTYGYMLKPDDTVILVGPKKPPMAP